MAVKEKSVELIELFYDLIFVYAISQLTSLISQPVNNGILPGNFFIYIITSFVILQAWLYFTNYVNRYGRWQWYEYLIACINMIAVIYMTNTISTQWNQMFFTFNVSMLILLLTVVVLYSIKAHEEHSFNGAAGNSIRILLIVCSIYVLALIMIFLGFTNLVIWLDVIAVLTGAFLPFFLRGNFDKSVISFPHLTERFELLTIITFGEAIVGMTHFFDVNNFNLVPIMVFLVIITMFGSYVIQLHNLVDHHREERSLRLMFSHYFIVISINLVTVVFELLHHGEINHWLLSALMILSLVIFYTSIMTNKQYYHDEITLTRTDILEMIMSIAIGSVVILIFIDSLYAFLLGTLVITVGCFIVLYNKNQELI